MLYLVWRTIKARGERTALVVLAVFVVSGAFGLLLASAETTKVTVDEDLAQYWRTSYDILVRPPGTRSPIEEERRLVRVNFLSSVEGGITLDQYDAIRTIPGVEVAAPIAMLGYFDLVFHQPLDISCEPGFYRLQNTATASDGLREYRVGGGEYFFCASQGGAVYHLYRNASYSLLAHRFGEPRRPSESPRETLPPDEAPWFRRAVFYLPLLLAAVDPEQERMLLALDRAIVQGEYLSEIEELPGVVHGRAGVSARQPISIPDDITRPRDRADPKAAATQMATMAPELTATPQAIVTAEALSAPEVTTTRGGPGDLPIILNSRSYVSFSLETEWQRIALPFTQEALDRVEGDGGKQYLAGLPVEPLHRWEFQAQEAYRAALALLGGPGTRLAQNTVRPLPSGVLYVEASPPPGTSEPTLEAVPYGIGVSGGARVIAMPLVSSVPEMHFRERPSGSIGGDIPFVLQGVYDIERLPRPEELSEVPLETYFSPRVTLRYDEAGRPVSPASLGPTFNITGYIAMPPLALTTLRAGVRASLRPEAPISAVRVRVAGVDELSPVSQAKIEAVAAEIIERTGLPVDITVGSSPRRLLVRIPGDKRIPAVGYVEEGWVQKGLSYTVASETNSANVLLFSVMLAVSILLILNTSLINTLARRWEIAVYKAVGWRTDTVFMLVLSEGALVGLVAGSMGLVLALLLATIFQLDMPLERVLLILPLGVALCLLGSLLPAFVAARIPPAQSLSRGEISAGGVRLGALSIPSFAWRQAVRRRARMGLTIMTVAAASGLVTLLLGVALYAQGYLSGTLLGEYILLRIQGYHFILAGVAFGLVGLATADVLLMGVAERRREIGVLKAVGWRNNTVVGLFLWEAVGLAIVGGVLGWGVGASFYWVLYRDFPLAILSLLGPSVLLPVVVSLLAAIYPAWRAARVVPAEAMRQE